MRLLRGGGRQLLVAGVVLALLVGLGVSPLAALSMTASGVRVGLAAVRRIRGARARRAVDAAAPEIARALATELAMWGNGARAIVSARCESRVAARVLSGASARVVLGGDAPSSLQRALLDVAPDLHPTSAAARLSAVFALHRCDSAATAASLSRLADALESDAAAHDDVRAASAEVRMSAIAVPLLAAATLAMLLGTDPAALLAALSLPVLPIVGVCIAVVACASLAVRRLVAP
jgi:Flp pilus assembly protein TadB